MWISGGHAPTKPTRVCRVASPDASEGIQKNDYLQGMQKRQLTLAICIPCARYFQNCTLHSRGKHNSQNLSQTFTIHPKELGVIHECPSLLPYTTIVWQKLYMSTLMWRTYQTQFYNSVAKWIKRLSGDVNIIWIYLVYCTLRSALLFHVKTILEHVKTCSKNASLQIGKDSSTN